MAQVGDPGAHPLFSGVALKRATATESSEDAAAGEFLLEQARLYAKKLSHVLECMRGECFDRGGQLALVRTTAGSKGRERRHPVTATSPFVAKISELGPSESDTAYIRVTPTTGNANKWDYYGDTPENGSKRMLVQCEHTIHPDYPADRRLLLALDAVSDGFSRADLGYIAQPPGHYVKPPRAKEVGFRRRVDISENVRKEDYVVHGFDEERGFAAGPVNELIVYAARLSGAPSRSTYASPVLHRIGLAETKLSERSRFRSYEDYSDPSRDGDGFSRDGDGFEHEDLEPEDLEPSVDASETSPFGASVKEFDLSKSSSTYVKWNREFTKGKSSGERKTSSKRTGLSRSDDFSYVADLERAGQTTVFCNQRAAVLATAIPKRRATKPSYIREPARVAATSRAPQYPGSARSVPMPKELSALLGTSRNELFLSQAGASIVGVHKLELKHLTDRAHQGKDSLLCLHGTDVNNVPSIL